MASLVAPGKFGSINTTGITTNEFYVIMFTSEKCTLQDNTIIHKQIITAGGLVVKAQYIFSMQVDTNWYWNQHHQHHVIIVPTHTIIHPQLEVNAVTYSHTIPKSICTRTQGKKNPYQDSLYVD